MRLAVSATKSDGSYVKKTKETEDVKLVVKIVLKKNVIVTVIFLRKSLLAVKKAIEVCHIN